MISVLSFGYRYFTTQISEKRNIVQQYTITSRQSTSRRWSPPLPIFSSSLPFLSTGRGLLPSAAPLPHPHRAAGRGEGESHWGEVNTLKMVMEAKMVEEAHLLLRIVKTRTQPELCVFEEIQPNFPDLVPLFAGEPHSAIIWSWSDRYHHHN